MKLYAYHRHRLVASLFASVFCLSLSAKAQKMEPLPLTDLKSFSSPAANWRLAGGVTASRTKNHDLNTSPGTGVLVNLPTKEARGNLQTSFSHGDLDLELDVMMPKGSNSGIYLMGRYEVQLFDSWEVASPAHSDMGGIYQRWNDKAPTAPYDLRGYEGKAPRQNACKAPGLWQRLSIKFQAPRFDASGKKLSNARFVRVVLNNTVIHENAEVTGPTRGAVSQTEVPSAPLMIQGDHGPVAFQNISYHHFGTAVPKWENLTYDVWYGDIQKLEHFLNKKPAKSGQADLLSWSVSDQNDKFAIRYRGKLISPVSEKVKMTLGLEYRGRFVVNGKILLDTTQGAQRWWKRNTFEVDLKQGANEIEVINFKNASKNLPSIELNLSSESYRLVQMHDLKSMPDQQGGELHILSPDSRPRLQRVFVKQENKVRPYTLAAGHPEGVHYFYDLSTGGMFGAWRSGFLNMQGLWDSRGSDQVAWPLGGRLELPTGPAVVKLVSPDAVWPDTLVGDDFKHLHYKLDAAGYPTIVNLSQGMKVEDKISPVVPGAGLKRELTTNADATIRVATGASITALADGSYLVDNGLQSHYIIPGWAKTVKATLRTSNGKQELLVPASANVKTIYTLIW